jgi:putative membrane protein
VARILLLAALCAIPSLAAAHVIASRDPTNNGIAEWLEVGVPILLAAFLYARGLLAVLAHSTRGAAEWRFRAPAFGAGLAVLILALLSPLDRWGGELFAVHMVQHEVLMLAAAPLLVLGRPLPVFLWAFSGSWRRSLARVSQSTAVDSVWRTLAAPLSAWLLHALALWVWHVPAFFNAVLTNRAIHDLQHFTFLTTALLFWTALFQERRRDHQGAAILYLFTTTVHTSVLGALITFATRPWYSAYLQTSQSWGFTALEDQQLGGLIMWVPASLVYIGAALVLLARWISLSDRTAAVK